MSGDRSGRRVLLGVSGGIAAYKAAALASELVQRGDDVCVVMTAGAERFVGAATFAALPRRRVRWSRDRGAHPRARWRHTTSLARRP